MTKDQIRKMSDAELVLAYESAKPRKHSWPMFTDTGEDREAAAQYLAAINARRLTDEQLKAAYAANKMLPPS